MEEKNQRKKLKYPNYVWKGPEQCLIRVYRLAQNDEKVQIWSFLSSCEVLICVWNSNYLKWIYSQEGITKRCYLFFQMKSWDKGSLLIENIKRVGRKEGLGMESFEVLGFGKSFKVVRCFFRNKMRVYDFLRNLTAVWESGGGGKESRYGIRSEGGFQANGDKTGPLLVWDELDVITWSRLVVNEDTDWE